MAKVKLTGLNRASKDLKNRIVAAIDRSNFDVTLPKDIAAEIRKNGIDPGLESKTIEYRGKIVSRKGPGYAQAKSSLTLSGQLLGALRSTFNKATLIFKMGVEDGVHKPYKYKKKNGKTSKHGGKAKLSDIFEGLSEDRPVTRVLDDDSFRLRMERKLVASIKRFFK